MSVFNGGFMRLGPDFSRFGRKDISCRVRNQMLDKIVFRQSLCLFFFTIFSSAFFFAGHYFIYVPAGFSKVLLALILGGTSKSHVFEKICIHLV